MGNHGSRREGRRRSRQNSVGGGSKEGQAVHVLQRVEELRGPPVDAYDKLIAWLSEMAESENVELDTSAFVQQLSSVCRSNAASSHSNSGTGPASTVSGATSNGYIGGPLLKGPRGGAGGLRGRRSAPTLRQHSACSYGEGPDPRPSQTFSRSFDDTLKDPRAAWRQQKSWFNSRQVTVSDELEEDPEDVRRASMESLYSGSDRDSEVEAAASTFTSTEPSPASRRTRFSQQCREQRELRRPLLRQALLGSSTCSSQGAGSDVPGSCGSPAAPTPGTYDGPLSARGSLSSSSGGAAGSKYPGYGSCSTRCSMVTISSALLSAHMMPCSVSTGDLDKLDTALEEVSGPQPQPERLLARRRSASLLNLSPPGGAYAYSTSIPPDAEEAAAAYDTYPYPGQPPRSQETSVAPPPFDLRGTASAGLFLDDTLLDGNMADILFSLEALWPKK